MKESAGRTLFVRMFGSAIIVQALLSASNFLVGLILIRHTPDSQYAYFVLVTSGIMLATGLQNAFIQPPMVIRMTRSTRAERGDLIGGLYRGQNRLLVAMTLAALAALVALRAGAVLDAPTVNLIGAAVLALVAALHREFLRFVLMSYRLSQDVLKADGCFVLAMLVGVPLATLSPEPAASAVAAFAVASCLGGWLLNRILWRREPWNRHASGRLLLEMAPLGRWSALGSGTHWAFSQGYNYLAAGTLDVVSVASLAATRMLMMPVNLVSSGICSLMMPTASGWLQARGPAVVFRRLLLVACGLSVGAVFYFALVWVLRDLIFDRVMHKHFAHGDTLVLIWFAVFLVMLFRDQLQYLIGVSGMYRRLTYATASSAVLSVIVGYVAMTRAGVVGAPFGVLVGEMANIAGIVYLSRSCIRHGAGAVPSTP